jgi:hypothetical protein
MLRWFKLTAVLFAVVSIGLAQAQTPVFDVSAYKNFLNANANITASQVQAGWPSPLFLKNWKSSGTGTSWLDSVREKYQLTAGEMALLQSNGFVVTQRPMFYSMGQMLIDIYKKDLPVFVSTDAILHALHMSYDNILISLETSILQPDLISALELMHTSGMDALELAYGGNSAMQEKMRDIDVYLTVARRLLLVDAVPARYSESEPVISELLAMIAAETPERYPLFSSTPRTIDFSQFTVRGHYTQQPWLGRYFKSMIWLGRTEFMFSSPSEPGGPPAQSPEDLQRQTIDAYLLKEAIEAAGAGAKLDEMDMLLQSLIGESDNIRLTHLQELQNDVCFTTADALLDPTTLAAFQSTLAAKSFAGQRINSQILMSDATNPDQLKPASAFLLMGQRFIIDSYVLGNVVYDKIVHDGTKVLRMLPTPQDALFALGNNASAQFLQDGLAKYHYGPNLTALRYLIDSYGDDFWNASLYNSWLNAIRALNPPQVTEGLPAFMQTANWWQQKMNTQLSSWAQLRHDNLLYAKPSYSGGNTCSYPEGYVEPFPVCYQRLAGFARNAVPLFRARKATAGIADFFEQMSTIMDTLQFISEKELAGTPLTLQERQFLGNTLYYFSIGCGDIINGWYQKLYFNCSIVDMNYVIADIHTAPTDEGGMPVGWVLHAAVGLPSIGFVIAPSQNGGMAVYSGPFMNYHETVTTNFKRLTDEEWKSTVLGSDVARPDWTNNYSADKSGARKPEGPSLLTIASGTEHPTPSAPGAPSLHDAYPNPATTSTGVLFSFTLPSTTRGNVTLRIFDMNGRLVSTILDASLRGGTYFSRWDGRTSDGSTAAAGVYVCRLTTEAGSIGRTVVVR